MYKQKHIHDPPSEEYRKNGITTQRVLFCHWLINFMKYKWNGSINIGLFIPVDDGVLNFQDRTLTRVEFGRNLYRNLMEMVEWVPIDENRNFGAHKEQKLSAKCSTCYSTSMSLTGMSFVNANSETKAIWSLPHFWNSIANQLVRSIWWNSWKAHARFW